MRIYRAGLGSGDMGYIVHPLSVSPRLSRVYDLVGGDERLASVRRERSDG
jgi:hypothetical protein